MNFVCTYGVGVVQNCNQRRAGITCMYITESGKFDP